MPSELAVGSSWQELPIPDLVQLMHGAPFFWCLAGGHAVSRAVGHQFRPHHDIDVVVLRSDLTAAQEWFIDWRLFAADPPGRLRRWNTGEVLPTAVHDIWCQREQSLGWELQLMVQESNAASWFYRRDPRIFGALDSLATNLHGVPCLRLDLQLLFKSKDPRPIDELDFRAALPRLTPKERACLIEWLRITQPDGHRWLTVLAA
jgi:hypothetical protein